MWLTEYYRYYDRRTDNYLRRKILEEYNDPHFIKSLKGSIPELKDMIRSNFEKWAKNYINNARNIVISPTPYFLQIAINGKEPKTLIEPKERVLVDVKHAEIEIDVNNRTLLLFGVEYYNDAYSIILSTSKHDIISLQINSEINSELYEQLTKLFKIAYLYHVHNKDSIIPIERYNYYKIKHYEIGNRIKQPKKINTSLVFGVRGHWRMQRYGKGLKKKKLIYIDDQIRKKK